MKSIIQKLAAYQTLSREEAKRALSEIGEGSVSASHMASFLTTFMMRTPTLPELRGFTEALQELCIRVDFEETDLMDLCGTGGDGKDTFNISTTATFVVAGAGQKVAKHGNYGISSGCGSSTVMESLGAVFTNSLPLLKAQMQASGVAFLHAPLFHPAMKHVGPIRRELGLKTFFNMLGPLVNPAFPQAQLTGVFNLELARMYAYLGQASGRNLVIVHDLGGYDEVSLTGPVKVLSPDREILIQPEDLGLRRWKADDLAAGKDVADSARILTNILQNRGTAAQTQVVLANAGLALARSGDPETWRSGIERAWHALESGEAWRRFQQFISQQTPV